MSLSIPIGTGIHIYPGVDSFTVNLETQEVIVKGSLPYEDVLAKIKKTGKEVCGIMMFVLAYTGADRVEQVRSGEVVRLV